jgi:translation initiation factor IF-1
MPGGDLIGVEGTVVAGLPGGRYRVVLANGHELIARIPRRHQAEPAQFRRGDRVNVEVSPCDFSQGRIKSVLGIQEQSSKLK